MTAKFSAFGLDIESTPEDIRRARDKVERKLPMSEREYLLINLVLEHVANKEDVVWQ